MRIYAVVATSTEHPNTPYLVEAFDAGTVEEEGSQSMREAFANTLRDEMVERSTIVRVEVSDMDLLDALTTLWPEVPGVLRDEW